MNKRIQNFNNHLFEVECEEARKEITKAHKLKLGLEMFKGGTLDEINSFLNEKTGWSNPTMSASAEGLEDEYNFVINNIGEVDFRNYNEDVTDLSFDYILKLREKHTTYHSEDETELLEKMDVVMEKLNALSPQIRSSIWQSREQEFGFDIAKYKFLQRN